MTTKKIPAGYVDARGAWIYDADANYTAELTHYLATTQPALDVASLVAAATKNLNADPANANREANERWEWSDANGKLSFGRLPACASRTGRRGAVRATISSRRGLSQGRLIPGSQLIPKDRQAYESACELIEAEFAPKAART